jgi:peptidoglycan/LPS O-acetylase OafA/YrhL
MPAERVLSSGRNYRPDIDGLRAIAILSVVFCHAGLSHVRGGFVGVDVFFVISGFLIGGHIFSDLEKKRFSFLDFYTRRAKRILPPLFFVVSFVMIAGFVLMSPFEFRRLSSRALATVLSLSNFLFWVKIDYFNPPTESEPLLMTWSLGVEEQFYLVIPLLMLLLSRLRKNMILPVMTAVIGASLVLSILQLHSHPTACFYLLPSRAWELAVGVAFALSESKLRALKPPSWFVDAIAAIGLLLIAASCLKFDSATPFPGLAAVPSVIGAAFLIASRQSFINRRILASAPMAFIGRVSYSWYLWHWPLMAFIRLGTGGDLPLKAALVSLVVSFLLAVLSYYVVETPLRASKRPPAKLLPRYAAITLLFTVILLFFYLKNGFPRRYPQLASQEALIRNISSNPCLLEGDQLTAPSFCLAASQYKDKFVLWGDSHASAISPVLQAKVEAAGYVFYPILHSGCPPLIGVARFDSGNPPSYKVCLKFNERALQTILTDPEIKVVALASYWVSTFDPERTQQLIRFDEGPLNQRDDASSLTLLDQSLRHTTQVLLNAHKKVVVFNDSPLFHVLPMWRMRTSQNRARMRLWSALGGVGDPDPGIAIAGDLNPVQLSVQRVVLQFAASSPAVHFWDLRRPLSAGGDLYRYREGFHIYYADDSHLTAFGAGRALQGWTPPPLE